MGDAVFGWVAGLLGKGEAACAVEVPEPGVVGGDVGRTADPDALTAEPAGVVAVIAAEGTGPAAVLVQAAITSPAPSSRASLRRTVFRRPIGGSIPVTVEPYAHRADSGVPTSRNWTWLVSASAGSTTRVNVPLGCRTG